MNCANPTFEQPLVREAVSIVHDLHTVCVNDTELDALCEIDKSLTRISLDCLGAGLFRSIF